MSNTESLQLIKDNKDKFTKPSEILRFAAENNIKQIRNSFNDNNCGYCATGFITQYMGGGKEMFEWIEIEEFGDKIKGYHVKEEYLLELYNKTNQVDYTLILFLKSLHGVKNFKDINTRTMKKVSDIIGNMIKLNDDGYTFDSISDYLENKGF